MAIEGFKGIKKPSFEKEYGKQEEEKTPIQEELLNDDIELEFDESVKDESNNNNDVKEEVSDNKEDKDETSSPSDEKETETIIVKKDESYKLSDAEKELLEAAKKEKERNPEWGLNDSQKKAKREISWSEREPEIGDLIENARYDIYHQKVKDGKDKGLKMKDVEVNTIRKKQMVDYFTELMNHNPELTSITKVKKKEAEYLVDKFFEMLEETLDQGIKPGGYLNAKRTFQGARRLNIAQTIYKDYLKDDEDLLQTPKIVLSMRYNTDILTGDMKKDIVEINNNHFIKVVKKDGKNIGYKSGIVYNDDLNKHLSDLYVDRFSLTRSIANVRSKRFDKR